MERHLRLGRRWSLHHVLHPRSLAEHHSAHPRPHLQPGHQCRMRLSVSAPQWLVILQCGSRFRRSPRVEPQRDSGDDRQVSAL